MPYQPPYDPGLMEAFTAAGNAPGHIIGRELAVALANKFGSKPSKIIQAAKVAAAFQAANSKTPSRTIADSLTEELRISPQTVLSLASRLGLRSERRQSRRAINEVIASPNSYHLKPEHEKRITEVITSSDIRYPIKVLYDRLVSELELSVHTIKSFASRAGLLKERADKRRKLSRAERINPDHETALREAFAAGVGIPTPLIIKPFIAKWGLKARTLEMMAGRLGLTAGRKGLHRPYDQWPTVVKKRKKEILEKRMKERPAELAREREAIDRRRNELDTERKRKANFVEPPRRKAAEKTPDGPSEEELAIAAAWAVDNAVLEETYRRPPQPPSKRGPNI